MKHSQFILTAVFISLLFSCQRTERKTENFSLAVADLAVTDTLYKAEPDLNNGARNMSSTAAQATGDTSRAFIRTADVKFKVRNVYEATTAIEDVTTHFGGFVTRTKLISSVNDVKLVPVSSDSSLESTSFTVSNTLVIRVPNTALDTALRSLTSLVEFLDYREVEAEDVRLNLLANRLAQSRALRAEKRLTSSIDEHGKKLNQVAEVEESVARRQDQQDEAHLANLTLRDKVEYSTISLSIYQRPSISQVVVSNNRSIEAFRPGFGARLGESFHFGLSIFEEIILFLVRIWVILVGGIATAVLYRLYRRSRAI